MSWTVERVALLRLRAGEGATARAIANELGGGITRSAVIGKANRDDIPLKPDRPTYVSKPATPARAAHEAEKLRLMRRADTQAQYRHGIGGLLRNLESKKPVTLAKLNIPDMVD